MNDRELLELSYKAANGGAIFWDDKDVSKHWNPLTNDGDALRLAVKLKLSLYTPFWNHANFAEVGIREPDGEVKSICREYNDNSYAATRRAIVRAAAAIGKEMK